MTEKYTYVIGADGEIYEVLPTDALLSFLQRLAEDEKDEPETGQKERELTSVK